MNNITNISEYTDEQGAPIDPSDYVLNSGVRDDPEFISRMGTLVDTLSISYLTPDRFDAIIHGVSDVCSRLELVAFLGGFECAAKLLLEEDQNHEKN